MHKIPPALIATLGTVWAASVCICLRVFLYNAPIMADVNWLFAIHGALLATIASSTILFIPVKP